MIVYDRYGRAVTNLRIAVTHDCNLNCIYCHKEGEDYTSQCSRAYSKNGIKQMTTDEIERVVRVAAELGIKKIKITGGEPLIRKDIVEIVNRISKINGIEEVSMVTNGLLLEKYAKKLKDAGLKRINVSLPSPNPERYRLITRYPLLDGPERVIRGIKEAIKAGLNPVKINMVVLRNLNEVDIEEEIKIAREVGAILQLIELQDPLGKSEIYKKYHRSLNDIEKRLNKDAKRVIIRNLHHRRKYVFEDNLEIEIVNPMHNSDFCSHCSRLRITSKGELKPCLLRDDNHVPFLEAMRKGINNDELKKLFIEAILRREPFFK
ncbi:MAG: GTP 3',8-cyclase MoaA [Candidatus Asgardarchaeia archaeon]